MTSREDDGNRHAVGDGEGQVQVGVAVAAGHRERPHSCSRHDAVVFLREPEQALAEPIALLNGEHEARVQEAEGEGFEPSNEENPR